MLLETIKAASEDWLIRLQLFLVIRIRALFFPAPRLPGYFWTGQVEDLLENVVRFSS